MFYGCLSFFNEKYRYFATFDQQILAEKLVFRILQHRFSRGSTIFKMIVDLLTEHFVIDCITFSESCEKRNLLGGVDDCTAFKHPSSRARKTPEQEVPFV